MKHFLRHGKIVLLTMVLAVTSLTVAAPATPSAHAAALPSITAYGLQEAVEVQGSGFTPGGTVWVGVFDTNHRLLNSETVTASRNAFVCSPITHICRFIFSGGKIDAYVGTASYYGNVYVLAADDSTSEWSNEPTTYVRIIP
ncbi:MAG TPA: hypothetical protein VIJ28_01700 [Chloroflexota bacterium]|jgi:hypothetical protein